MALRTGLPTHVGCRHPESDPTNDQFCIFCLRKRGDDAILAFETLSSAVTQVIDLARPESSDACKRILSLLESAAGTVAEKDWIER